jgi:hypothetical protein
MDFLALGFNNEKSILGPNEQKSWNTLMYEEIFPDPVFKPDTIHIGSFLVNKFRSRRK